MGKRKDCDIEEKMGSYCQECRPISKILKTGKAHLKAKKLFKNWDMKVIFISLSIILNIGCLNHYPYPTIEERSKADYGNYPSNYQDIVKKYFEQSLKDPESARYNDWIGPSKGFMRDLSRIYYGYRVCVKVNAKNSYGGYTGRKLYYFIINNEIIIYEEGGASDERAVNTLCSSIITKE